VAALLKLAIMNKKKTSIFTSVQFVPKEDINHPPTHNGNQSEKKSIFTRVDFVRDQNKRRSIELKEVEPPLNLTKTTCSGWSVKRDGTQIIEVDIDESQHEEDQRVINALDVGDLDYKVYGNARESFLCASDKTQAFADITDDVDAIKSSSRASDYALKQNAMNISVEEFFGFKCNYRYCSDNSCIGRVCAEANLDNVFAHRRALWGPKESKEPTTKQRGDRLFALQQKCWDASQSKFVYSFRAASSSKATTVCENAYLFLLGYKKDPITGHCRSGQFNDNKKRIENNQG